MGWFPLGLGSCPAVTLKLGGVFFGRHAGKSVEVGNDNATGRQRNSLRYFLAFRRRELDPSSHERLVQTLKRLLLVFLLRGLDLTDRNAAGCRLDAELLAPSSAESSWPRISLKFDSACKMPLSVKRVRILDCLSWSTSSSSVKTNSTSSLNSRSMISLIISAMCCLSGSVPSSSACFSWLSAIERLESATKACGG